MNRHAALTSTYTNVLDSSGTLSQQSLSKAHRERIKRVARGVLVAIGLSLFLVPSAGSSDMTVNKTYIDYKTYSLYLLDFNYKEYYCLEMLYTKESNWRPDAKNGSHYGIPQGRSEYLATLDGWGQVRWGLDYIGHRYGEPCVALDHWKAKGWH
jgi:hypothetical protein